MVHGKPPSAVFRGRAMPRHTRGDGRDAIYGEDGDRRMFRDLLGGVRRRFNWILHTFCLMTHHYQPFGRDARGQSLEEHARDQRRLYPAVEANGKRQGLTPRTSYRGASA